MGERGKRVSWVELFFDLVFVLAVGQLAHLVVAEPEMPSVWKVLGLFFTLWWTWIGFAVLYNRHGSDHTAERLLFLAASVPAGVAAVAIEPAATGESTAFVVAMAAIRLLLAGAEAAGDARSLLRRRAAVAYAVSALMFGVSAVVPEPWRYLVWGAAITFESGAILTDDRQAARRARREHRWAALTPKDPEEALDADHFAERFGLFLIILLGEVVVEAGQASVDGHVAAAGGWAALVAAMVFAGALWWLYFDSAAEVNRRVLELSGGSPTMARAIYAFGHMQPAFSLLMMAAGVGLLLEEDPPRIAYGLAAFGLGIYLLGTRVFLRAGRHVSGAARVLLLVATFFLGRLHDTLSGHEFVWLLAAWAVACAVISSRSPRSLDERLATVPPDRPSGAQERRERQRAEDAAG